eukprot:Nk52_evm2s156 gene=Nk52_evmTU2s156
MWLAGSSNSSRRRNGDSEQQRVGRINTRQSMKIREEEQQRRRGEKRGKEEERKEEEEEEEEEILLLEEEKSTIKKPPIPQSFPVWSGPSKTADERSNSNAKRQPPEPLCLDEEMYRNGEVLDFEEEEEEELNQETLVTFRKLVKDNIMRHMYPTALYWADKAFALGQGRYLCDVYWLAQTFYLTRQYKRAILILQSRDLIRRNIFCRYLTARCYVDCKCWQAALDLLDVEEIEMQIANQERQRKRQQEDGMSAGATSGGVKEQQRQSDAATFLDYDLAACGGSEENELVDHIFFPNGVGSCLYVLLGIINEVLDNRDQASFCYCRALKLDVYNFEAFDRLMSNHMLTSEKERKLMDTLPFRQQCGEHASLIQVLYGSKLKKYATRKFTELPSRFAHMENGIELQLSKAEEFAYKFQFRKCFEITSAILERHPFELRCIQTHIICLLELGFANELYKCVFSLIANHPDKAVSWFGVGCYYYLVKNNEQARRYFSKATQLDVHYGPAWVGFGHSFAAEREHDQAMAAYCTASRLLKGCHLPLMYIGMEYIQTHNITLAKEYFLSAKSVCDFDPLVPHELGVVSYVAKDYSISSNYFLRALDLCGLTRDVLETDNFSLESMEPYEATLTCLGHCYRKQRMYKKAIYYYNYALKISPTKSSVVSALAYAHHLNALVTGDAECMDTAINLYHKALSFDVSDVFSQQMLTKAFSNYHEHFMSEVLEKTGGLVSHSSNSDLDLKNAAKGQEHDFRIANDDFAEDVDVDI